MPELGKCPYCGGELKVEPFIYRLEELPKPIKLFGRWSLIKMRYREIPTGYTVECADFCDGFADSCLYAVGLSKGEAIAEWNRKVNDANLH